MSVLINSLWVFVVFAFLGWLMQFGIRAMRKHDIVNTGFITLPFSLNYGLGATVIFLAFGEAKNYAMVFFGAMAVLTVLKFISAKLFENTFRFKWEDKSDKRFNLNGYVTLGDMLFYGGASVVLTAVAFPLIKLLVSKCSYLASLIIPLVAIGLIVADLILSTITVLHLRRNLKEMKNISSLIEDSDSQDNEELRSEYEEKLMKNKLFRKRLVKAFPDMEAFDYEKQFDDLKVKLNLIKEKNDEVYTQKIENDEEKPFAFGLSFSKLFWLFFIGSFFGTAMETIWSFFQWGHFEVRVGLVWGPFIPIYGGGAVMITLCLYKMHKANNGVIFLCSAVIGATFEYFASYFQEKVLGTISWDYSDTLFNIDGRTNLMYGLIWGALGLAWIRYIYPVFSRNVERIPKKIGKVLTVILVIFMIANAVMSCAAVYRKTQRDLGIQSQSAFGEFLDDRFPDERMDFLFPHMRIPKDE